MMHHAWGLVHRWHSLQTETHNRHSAEEQQHCPLLEKAPRLPSGMTPQKISAGKDHLPACATLLSNSAM